MSRLLSWLYMLTYCGCVITYGAVVVLGLLALVSWYFRLWWWF